MRVTIERGLVHRCPHVAEWDHGTVIASWEGDTVELHDLAKHLDGYEGRALTHEAVTEFIALHLRATGAQRVEVITRWMTAGMAVTVTAGSDA